MISHLNPIPLHLILGNKYGKKKVKFNPKLKKNQNNK